jgi:hypothetical protein
LYSSVCEPEAGCLLLLVFKKGDVAIVAAEFTGSRQVGVKGEI